MAVVRLPFLPRSKPNDLVLLDYSNPLSAGIYEAFCANSLNTRTALGNNIAYGATKSSYFKTGINRGGYFVGDGTTNTSPSFNGRVATFLATQSMTCTVVIRPQLYTSGGSAARLIGSTWYGIYGYDGSVSKFTGYFRFSDSTTAPYSFAQDSSVYELGKTYILSVVFNNGVGASFWINGKMIGSVANTNPAVLAFNDVRTYAWMQPSMYAHHLRALGDSEIVSLHANPWQLFAPQRIFVPVSAGVSFPTLSAATYMPGSITSSGFRPRVTAS